MLGFLKKLFGGDAATNKEAGIQVEQVPYKVEVPVATKVEAVNAQPVVKEAAPVAKPAAKKTAPKKPAPKKPAPKQGGPKKGGRKPKAKPAA
jgi:hypothetical protein